MKQANLKLKKSKCAFFKMNFTTLAIFLLHMAINPQTEKINVISEMKLSTNQKGVRDFFWYGRLL